MTAHPTAKNAHAWWLVSGKERRLHGVSGRQVSEQQMRDAIGEAKPVPGRAACGLWRRWRMPGLIWRLARTRCAPCCWALGIRPGYGTPTNEASIEEGETDG